MENIEISLHYEMGTRRYEDFFGLGHRRADDLDELNLDDDRFNAIMDALMAVSPAPIYFVDIPGGKNGCYGHAQNEVYVSWCIAPAMMIRTTLHEMVHAILHPWPGGVKPADELPRAIRETEAEGVAYLVCLHYGLDVSAYSLDYIHSWIRHLTDDEAKKSIDIIRKTADKLVMAIDAELEKQI